MRATKEIADGHFNGPVRSSPKPLTPSRGMVVALVGPDGVGKSSQTARLTSLLQPKFKCTAIYLGSGDGGWRLRRMAKRHFRKWRGRVQQAGSGAKRPETHKEYGSNHSVWTGLSGLVAALERYVSLRRAARLARSGSVVICDRWPQNMLPGLFDGPLRLDSQASRTIRLMSQVERSIYNRMATYRPDLTIHLVSDFDTSKVRKPGDRTPADFDQRLALMQEMRTLDPAIIMVDASKGFDEVTEDLRSHIFRALDAAI